MSDYISYKEIVHELNLEKGDIVLVGSDVTRLAVQALKNGEKFNANLFLDSLINKIGEEGTLLLPTYNWGFCEGEAFNYFNTPSKTGILTNTALKRQDFKRTKHPIYSFAVWGKDQELLCNMNNKSSFGEDSPFAYLHKHQAKMITIDLCYQDSFTFVHYVEEMEKVTYRYMKNFTNSYIDELGVESIRTYSMNVRNLEQGVMTRINPIGNKLEFEGASLRKAINNVDFYIIDLCKSYDIIKNDIVNNDGNNLYEIKLTII